MNPLLLPELREMLAEGNTAELEEFCNGLHPVQAAEFMEGLAPSEIWGVLRHADLPLRAEIFGYFELPVQINVVEGLERADLAELISEMPPDDRVDLLKQMDSSVVAEVLPLLPSVERRDILHLQSYAEETAGAEMTSEFAKLSETLTVSEALNVLGTQAEELETIYYLYIVDDQDHLRGVVSARQLISALAKPDTKLGDIMETALVTANVNEDQEEAAQKVELYNLQAIPVVDEQRTIKGIITHDDIIDVVREEAAEDAQRSAAVEPLEESYLDTSLLTLVWKRCIWLSILFFAALLTAKALEIYEKPVLKKDGFEWLVLFIPLVISSGGNTGSQSATLIITAMTMRNVELRDWRRVVRRELLTGLCLGFILAALGMASAAFMRTEARTQFGMWVVPLTLLAVVLCGALSGTVLPLLFKRMGLDPALMSNPFVAGIADILGIVIYMTIAQALL